MSGQLSLLSSWTEGNKDDGRKTAEMINEAKRNNKKRGGLILQTRL
jgi:hypothetical protein